MLKSKTQTISNDEQQLLNIYRTLPIKYKEALLQTGENYIALLSREAHYNQNVVVLNHGRQQE